MKNIIGVALITLLNFGAEAQEDKSKGILSELSEKAKTFKTVNSSFTMTYESANGSKSSSNGSALIKGQKFKLITGEGQDIICDGRTVWTHIIDDQIVYKCPKEEAFDGEDISDPSELFTIWEKNFKSRYYKEETVGSKKYDVIRLHPSNPTKVKFHTITLKVDQASKQVDYFIIKSNDGSTTTYKIKTFKINMPVGEGSFKWVNKAGVDIEEC